MFNTKKWIPAFLGLAFAGACLAQTVEPGKFYKLDFVVKEVEGGKTINSRSFSTILATPSGQESSPSASIRTSARVPFTTLKGEFIYNDLYVNIDCRSLREAAGDVTLSVQADIQSPVTEPSQPAPVIRSIRWASNVIVPVRKPTVIFASDDATSKRQTQLEITATLIK